MLLAQKTDYPSFICEQLAQLSRTLLTCYHWKLYQKNLNYCFMKCKRISNTENSQTTLFLGVEHKAVAMNVGVLKRAPLKLLKINATFPDRAITKNARSGKRLKIEQQFRM